MANPPTKRPGTRRAERRSNGSAAPGQTPRARTGSTTRRAPHQARRRSGHDRLGRPSTAVVVTGGASGIGRATCTALAEAGRGIAVWDLDGAGARRVARACADRYGVSATGIAIDVRDSPAIERAARRTRSAVGPVGGLVHAAGVGGPAPVTLVDDTLWDEVLDVNLRAAAILTRVFHQQLKDASPGSAIVYISSIEAYFGNTWLPAYCSSKSGLLGLTRSAAHTLGPDGIRVNAVCPGAVDTPLLAPLLAMPGMREALERRTPLQRIAEPEDIAKVVRFLLSEEAGHVTGTSVVVDGGMTAIAGV